MKPIKITESHEEMVSIGKDIAQQKKTYYNGQLLKTIADFVSERLPKASKKEIEDIVYITIYCYWVYGCTYEECLNYGFPTKTHDQRLTYMTYRLRLQYVDHLSKKEDAHLLSNKYETYQLFKEEFKRDVILCKSEEDYPAFLDFIHKHPEFVIKPTDMSCGRGVHKESVVGLVTSKSIPSTMICLVKAQLIKESIDREKSLQ